MESSLGLEGAFYLHHIAFYNYDKNNYIDVAYLFCDPGVVVNLKLPSPLGEDNQLERLKYCFF